MNILRSKYIKGSDGSINLFFREKGQPYTCQGVEETLVAEEDTWIIQWAGEFDYDSGYFQESFNNKEDALDRWERKVEMGEI